MSKSDKEVGMMVRECREYSRMTQEDVAAVMRMRGYKWSQATVWSIESGERPLRYTEAIELGHFCGFGADSENGYKEGIQRGIEMSRQALERLA